MSSPARYSVVRSIAAGPAGRGRWEVRDASGTVVGIVAEEPASTIGARSTFTVVHSPTEPPFRPRGAWPRAGSAWSGEGYRSVPAAAAALVRYLSAGRA